MDGTLIPKKETQQIITDAELQEIRKHVEQSIYSSPLVKRVPEVQDYIDKLFSIPVQKYAIDRIRKQLNAKEWFKKGLNDMMVMSHFSFSIDDTPETNIHLKKLNDRHIKVFGKPMKW